MPRATSALCWAQRARRPAAEVWSSKQPCAVCESEAAESCPSRLVEGESGREMQTYNFQACLELCSEAQKLATIAAK